MKNFFYSLTFKRILVTAQILFVLLACLIFVFSIDTLTLGGFIAGFIACTTLILLIAHSISETDLKLLPTWKDEPEE